MKVTSWFKMALPPDTGSVQLVPQTEEGITEVRWRPGRGGPVEPDAFGNIARLMAAWRANAELRPRKRQIRRHRHQFRAMMANRG